MPERHTPCRWGGSPPTARPPTPDLCEPFFHWSLSAPVCLPRFTIIGAQKAGTTSMFAYLGQHPQVLLPKEKELNFWGSIWPPTRSARSRQPGYDGGRMVSMTDFLQDYMPRFPLRVPTDEAVHVYGEGSPDYLVAGPQVLSNLLRYMPLVKLVVSLREPIARACSAYANKKADGTLHKHLLRNRDALRDTRLDGELSNYTPPTLDSLALDAHGSSVWWPCTRPIVFPLQAQRARQVP